MENIGLVYSKIFRSIIQLNVLLNKESLFKFTLQDVNFKQTTLELVDNEGWKGQVSRGKIQSFKIPYKFTKHVQELYLTCLSNNDNAIHLSINYFQDDNSTLCNGNEMQRQIVSFRKTVVRLVPNSNDNLFEKTTYYFNIFVGCLTEECSFHMHFSDNYQTSMAFIKENEKTSNKLPTASGEVSNSVVGDNSSVIVPTVLGASLLFESVALFTCIILLIICLKKNQNKFTKGETLLKDESDQSYTKV